jgi:3'-phosphoadenosine 5'-phosphosulfate sulfotransferase
MLHNIDNCKGYDNIEIAKGKYELATTWKQAIKQIKREWKRK